MNKVIFLAAVLGLSVSALVSTPALAEDFCGQIDSVYFKDFNGKISAYIYLTDVKHQHTGESFEFSKLTVRDPQVVFKIARVISKSSIQNSGRLEQNLRDSNFEWDANVNDEEHPNPMVEDFEACLSAPLALVKDDGIVLEVTQINDILEDGYSILNLVN